MRALVVYESMFGNTAEVAHAIADGLSAHMSVETVEVGAAPPSPGEEVDLLVVGGPTHAFSMSRPESRESAAKQAKGPLVSTGRGLREWLAALPRGCAPAAATFDTRVKVPLLPGSAARAAQKRLRRLGIPIAAPATSFYVTTSTGPLAEGELDRARDWARSLAASLTAHAV